MRTGLTILALAVLGGCGGEKPPADQSSSRDLQLAATDSTSNAQLADVPQAEPAPPPAATQPSAPRTTSPTRSQTPPPARRAADPPPAPEPAPPPAPRTRDLAIGTSFVAAATDTVTSRKNKAGETMTARLATAVTDDAGHTVIPAGATVTFDIVELGPATNKSQTEGKLVLRPAKVTIDGESYPLVASVTKVEYTLKGRGVTGSEAAKVGVGAAAGAIAGRVLGGNTKGAVVGGVVGAAAGAAVANETADRDVVIVPGSKITIVLREALAIPIS